MLPDTLLIRLSHYFHFCLRVVLVDIDFHFYLSHPIKHHIDVSYSYTGYLYDNPSSDI